MRTRNEVIVGVSKDLDIIPVLGAHKWKHICTDVEQRTKSDVLVFEYNYPMKGPPGKQQWRDDVPRLTGDERKFHFVDPYPAPSYVERPSNVLDIALPLPAGLRPTPPPPDSQDGPSEPPSSIPKGSKLDPYEQETLAAQSLSSSNVKAEQTPEDVEADRILQESFDEYQRMISQPGLIGPTPEKKEEPPTEEEMRILQQNFDAVQRAAGSITLPEPIKEEAPDAEADRILNELFMAVQQQRAGSQANVKTEGSGDTQMSPAAPQIKPEPSEDPRQSSQYTSPPTAASGSARVKEEPVDHMARIKQAQAATKARQQINTVVKPEPVHDVIPQPPSFSRLSNVMREAVDSSSTTWPTSSAKKRQGETGDGTHKRVKME